MTNDQTDNLAERVLANKNDTKVPSEQTTGTVKNALEILTEFTALAKKIDADINSQIERIRTEIYALNDKSSMLGKLPQQFKLYLQESVPEIAEAIRLSMFEKLDKSTRACYDNLETVDAKVESVLSNLDNKVDNVLNKLQQIDRIRLKRIFITIVAVVFTSTLTSASTAYYILRKFPQYIEIKPQGEVNIKNSDIHFWGNTDQVVNKKSKQNNNRYQ